MSNKELFLSFCKQYKGHLHFSQHYNWWNEVVEKNWDVAIYQEEGVVFGVWPYQIRKRGPWTLLVQPHFTPYVGPVLNYPKGQKNTTRHSFEKKVLENLMNQLPKFSSFKQNLGINFINTLPMLWKGFIDQRRFTYLLDLKAPKEELWSSCRENIRRSIRKAEKSIKIEVSLTSKELEKAFSESYKKQGLANPIQEGILFQRIIDYLKKHNCGQLLLAKNNSGDVVSALLSIWDKEAAYYLIGGKNDEKDSSGAMSLLMWKSILKAQELGLSQFNFEGSSIPSIEHYLRGFGGSLHGFSCLEKSNSLSLRILKQIKGN